MAIKRKEHIQISYISMLDLLTGALAAFIILFVMINQKNDNEQAETNANTDQKQIELEKVILSQNEIIKKLKENITTLGSEKKLEELTEQPLLIIDGPKPVFEPQPEVTVAVPKPAPIIEAVRINNSMTAVAGSKFIMKEIYFHPGTADIMYSSLKSLKEVADFLRDSNAYFVIEGHINYFQRNCARIPKVLVEISTKRAKAVFDYFMTQGLQPSHMRIDGQGCNKLIFPNPHNVDEESANRRVEIHIR